MNYWKFMDSKLQKGQEGQLEGQEGVPEREKGVPEGEEGIPEGEEGIPEEKQNINFEEEFCTALEKYAVELDRDRNVTPISKLVPASVNNLKWDCFTGKCLTTNMCQKKLIYLYIQVFAISSKC